MYKPDNWVILKVGIHPDDVHYKVLAGWSGGYLDGNSWRMNSGITKVEEDGDYYLFHGHTGSVYRCHKKAETLRMNSSGIYNQMKEKFGDKVNIVAIEELQLALATEGDNDEE